VRRGKQRQRWFAACFAVLLAIAPFARPSWTVDFAVAAASVESVSAYDDSSAQENQPAAGLRPAQPLTPGILSRLSSLEMTLGLPPVKSPLMRPNAPEEPLPRIRASTAFGGDLRKVFHRSSVGTARTPTGPPS
jgi:hypothetical protein